jgi:hypothetical protein
MLRASTVLSVTLSVPTPFSDVAAAKIDYCPRVLLVDKRASLKVHAKPANVPDPDDVGHRRNARWYLVLKPHSFGPPVLVRLVSYGYGRLRNVDVANCETSAAVTQHALVYLP